MNKVKIFFASISAMLLFGSVASQAQEWVGVNRDDYGNVVRGAYLTNEWFDNWYLGASAGVFGSFSKINDAIATPQFDFSLLKWFTPSIGARFGVQGFSGKEYLSWYNPYQINHSALPFDGPIGGEGTLSYGDTYFHGDLLLNLSSSLWGYKYKRFWTCSIYAHAGYYRMFDNSDGEGFKSENCDNEFAFGAGLYNTFRITERLVATLDARHFSTASRYKTLDGVRTNHFVASAGLAYNIYRTYWNRAQTIISENTTAKADAAAAQQALQRANDDIDVLEKKVAEKEAEIAAKESDIAAKNETIAAQEEAVKVLSRLDYSRDTEEVPYDALKARAEAADLVVYYYINVDKLNFSEQHHFDAYVSETLKRDPEHVFYLTGSADKGTGTFQRNTYLCRSRAYGIRDMLVKDYGVKEDHVVIKATVISDKHLDGALDRCVIIESK